ncbi:MAG: ATP-binding protein [Candidatus Magnetominusculus sp. LBB02]|nr:ATP-binding protein [Candidatus Magnetominusculus sp. LBB02]
MEITKLRSLILLRVFITYLLLASFFLFDQRFVIFTYPVLLSYLAAFIFFLTIIYLIIYKFLQKSYDKTPEDTMRPLYLFTYFQITFDIILIITLIMITGGIDSWFSFLLLVNVISAGITLGRRTILIIAGVSGVLYGVVLELQFYQILRVPYLRSLGPKDFFYNIFANITALLLVAYLSRYLLIDLEQTSRSLVKKERDFSDLFAFHREVIENIPSGLLYTDTEGKVMLFNRPAEQITGISRETAVGMTISDIFDFIGLPPSQGIYKGTMAANNKIIELRFSLHTDNSGQMMGFVITFEDLTKITELEREMKEKENLAAIGELSANIAHEIRNPLAALRASIEMLREGSVPADKTARVMEIALYEMDRLNKIITDFLVYSNPRPPQFTEVCVTAMLRETIEMLRNSLADPSAQSDSRLQIITEGLDEDVIITGDGDKLKQVFWNMCLNAMQSFRCPAKEDNAGQSRVVVAAKSAKGYVTITFQDNGVGIRPDTLKKIFYPFFTTKKGGSGLGLAIVYRIIQEHMGKINVRSAEGVGTTFNIILPATHEAGGHLDDHG